VKTGALIKEARLRVGLTQLELAGRLGVKQPLVARWENGVTRPSFQSLERALEACGLDLQIALVEHDDHDSGLIAQQLAMSPAQRMRNWENMIEFAEQAKKARTTRV
jgi:transcriptional regulator with XRE-family HTH domain